MLFAVDAVPVRPQTRDRIGTVASRAYPACSISPIPTTSNPAAAILGAPKRSLKNTAPIAAPTMIDDEKDRAKLEELKKLWLNDDDFTTADFRSMRAPILKRMKERQRKTVKRPIAVLEGIAGPEAEANWERLEKEEDYGTHERDLPLPVRSRGRPPTDQEGQGVRHRPGGDQVEPAGLLRLSSRTQHPNPSSSLDPSGR
jgi:hypothetical protein